MLALSFSQFFNEYFILRMPAGIVSVSTCALVGRDRKAQPIFLRACAQLIIPATPDCRPDYIVAMQATVWLVTNPGLASDASTSHALTIEVTKADIAREGATSGVDYAMTVSCTKPMRMAWRAVFVTLADCVEKVYRWRA